MANNTTIIEHKDLGLFLLRFGGIWFRRGDHKAALRAIGGGLFVMTCQLFYRRKEIGTMKTEFASYDSATPQEVIVSARRMFAVFKDTQFGYPELVKNVVSSMEEDAHSLLTYSQLVD